MVLQVGRLWTQRKAHHDATKSTISLEFKRMCHTKQWSFAGKAFENQQITWKWMIGSMKASNATSTSASGKSWNEAPHLSLRLLTSLRNRAIRNHIFTEIRMIIQSFEEVKMKTRKRDWYEASTTILIVGNREETRSCCHAIKQIWDIVPRTW